MISQGYQVIVCISWTHLWNLPILKQLNILVYVLLKQAWIATKHTHVKSYKQWYTITR